MGGEAIVMIEMGNGIDLTKLESRALRRIARRGRRGASALELSGEEMAGLALASTLVKAGFVIATSSNRFVLAKYAADIKVYG
jgi:hypothetical protein